MLNRDLNHLCCTFCRPGYETSTLIASCGPAANNGSAQDEAGICTETIWFHAKTTVAWKGHSSSTLNADKTKYRTDINPTAYDKEMATARGWVGDHMYFCCDLGL